MVFLLYTNVLYNWRYKSDSFFGLVLPLHLVVFLSYTNVLYNWRYKSYSLFGLVLPLYVYNTSLKYLHANAVYFKPVKKMLHSETHQCKEKISTGPLLWSYLLKIENDFVLKWYFNQCLYYRHPWTAVGICSSHDHIAWWRQQMEKKILVSDHFCGEFTGHWWIADTKTSAAELWCFLWSPPE